MSNYTLRLRPKTNYSPQVEGVKRPSEGCVGAFKFGTVPFTVRLIFWSIHSYRMPDHAYIEIV